MAVGWNASPAVGALIYAISKYCALNSDKGYSVHYKTNSRITSRIIRFGLVVDYQPDYPLNYQPDYRPGSAEVPAW